MHHLRVSFRILTVAFALSAAPARASAPPQVVRVHDLDYIRRTYYFIADHPIKVKPGTLHVWRDDRILETNTAESRGIARSDPTSPDTTAQIYGNFSLLQYDEDYSVVYPWITGNPGDIPVLRLSRALSSVELLGVSYVDDLSGIQVGSVSGFDFSAPDSILGKPANMLLIKLVAVEVNRQLVDPYTGYFDPVQPFYRVIPYELRNIYDLGLKHIPLDRFQLKVRKIDLGMTDGPDHIDGWPLIGILGLDQRTASGIPTPDGIVDDQFIEYEQGLLVFPDLHPFAPDTAGTWCGPGFGGFLCLDYLGRNSLWWNQSNTNPRVYYSLQPDPVADSRYYIESTVTPVPDPGGVLRQNRPNPFNPDTRIEFELNLPGRARVSIYDVRGRLVSELLNEEMTAGFHFVFWNGKSETNPVASGVYYYVLETGGHTYRKRMVLAR